MSAVTPLFSNKETDDLLNNNVSPNIITHSLKEEDHADTINVIKETYLIEDELKEDYISPLNVIQTENNNNNFEENYYLEVFSSKRIL